MGRSRRPLLALAVAVSALLAGCATQIEGTGSTSDGVRENVAPSDLEIVGSGEGDVDVLARNALADIAAFWTEQFPDVFGEEFTPLRGGIYSVDPDNFDPASYPSEIGCLGSPADVANNAFYCFPQPDGGGDNIVYDRTLLQSLSADYGRFIPALVMAHEFGHTVQGRVPPRGSLSIVYETQADCYAGAWSAWVAADRAEHFYIHPAELDDVLRGYLLLRDAPGSGPTEQGAHGSYFDRVGAFQEGYDDGAGACRDNYTDDRMFTQAEFSDGDIATEGNAPYDETIRYTRETLDTFWATQFAESFDRAWSAPELTPFTGGRPGCDGAQQRRDVTFCQAENRVDYDDAVLIPTVYADIGDFAVTTLVSISYAQAVRDELGLDYRGKSALRSSICLTGWYANAFFRGDIRRPGDTQAVSISPGDLDEAVQVLLDYGEQGNVLPDVGLSGFQLVDLFRQGFARGSAACDIQG